MNRKRLLCVICLLAMLLAGFPGPGMEAFAGFTEYGEPGSKAYVRRKDKRPVIILVGDSRTMMCTYQGAKKGLRINYAFCWVNGGNANVIRKGGVLEKHVRKMIRKYRGRCVVAMNFGVNGNEDPVKNAGRIIRLYRRWMKEYPDVAFYVVSVNPTNVLSGPYANKKVVKLNALLKKEFGPEGIYIDTYTRMMKKKDLVTGSALGMRDEYHYNWIAEEKILKWIRKFVTKRSKKG